MDNFRNIASQIVLLLAGGIIGFLGQIFPNSIRLIFRVLAILIIGTTVLWIGVEFGSWLTSTPSKILPTAQVGQGPTLTVSPAPPASMPAQNTDPTDPPTVGPTNVSKATPTTITVPITSTNNPLAVSASKRRFTDSFTTAKIDTSKWYIDELQYATIENSRLQFDVPVNTTADWRSFNIKPDLTAPEPLNISHIAFNVRIDTHPGTDAGVLGIEVPCGSQGLLDIYVGGEDGKLFADYPSKQANATDRMPSDQVIADGQEHVVEITWNDGSVTVSIDGVISRVKGIPCAAPDRVMVVAGQPSGAAIRGSIDDIIIDQE